jgi:hypothetical protein
MSDDRCTCGRRRTPWTPAITQTPPRTLAKPGSKGVPPSPPAPTWKPLRSPTTAVDLTFVADRSVGAKASRLPSLRSRTRDRIHVHVSGASAEEASRLPHRPRVEAAPPLPTVFPASPKGRRNRGRSSSAPRSDAIGTYPRGWTVPERREHPESVKTRMPEGDPRQSGGIRKEMGPGAAVRDAGDPQWRGPGMATAPDHEARVYS